MMQYKRKTMNNKWLINCNKNIMMLYMGCYGKLWEKKSIKDFLYSLHNDSNLIPSSKHCTSLINVAEL